METLAAIIPWIQDLPVSVLIGAVAVVAIIVAIVWEVLRQRLRRIRGRMAALRNEDTEAVRRFAGMLKLPIEDDVPLTGRENRQMVRVDHVLRLPASIAVVMYGPFKASGPITVKEGGAMWQVMVDGRDTLVPNPIQRMTTVMSAFAKRFPLVRVRGYLVLSNAVQLPPGVPKGVVTVDGFREALEQAVQDDALESPAVDHAWGTIQMFVKDMRERAAKARPARR